MEIHFYNLSKAFSLFMQPVEMFHNSLNTLVKLSNNNLILIGSQFSFHETRLQGKLLMVISLEIFLPDCSQNICIYV